MWQIVSLANCHLFLESQTQSGAQGANLKIKQNSKIRSIFVWFITPLPRVRSDKISLF